MNIQSVLTLLSLVTASLILLIGIVLLTGWFVPGAIQDNYRYTLGGIMTAYALYRIGMAISRLRRQGRTGKDADENDGSTDETS